MGQYPKAGMAASGRQRLFKTSRCVMAVRVVTTVNILVLLLGCEFLQDGTLSCSYWNPSHCTVYFLARGMHLLVDE